MAGGTARRLCAATNLTLEGEKKTLLELKDKRARR
jgi:hypothetical protein